MCLFEYDQEKHLRDTYEEGVEDGEKIGEKRGMNCIKQLTQQLLADKRLDELSRSMTDEAYCEQLLKEYHLI